MPTSIKIKSSIRLALLSLASWSVSQILVRVKVEGQEYQGQGHHRFLQQSPNQPQYFPYFPPPTVNFPNPNQNQGPNPQFISAGIGQGLSFGGNNIQQQSFVNFPNHQGQLPGYGPPPLPLPPPPVSPFNNILNQFQLPRQVRVPGRIEIVINGPDAEIICEFPRFLLLIQKIHWHHRYEDPYGTYFDTNNHFSPGVTIVTDDKYKSVLRIRNFDQKDYDGHYRCLSSAILPDEEPNPNAYLRQGQGQNKRSFPPPTFWDDYEDPLGSNKFVDFVNTLSTNYLFSKKKRRKRRSLYNYFSPSSSSSPSPLKLQPQLFAPFYKPSYGFFGVFQEIKFGNFNNNLRNGNLKNGVHSPPSVDGAPSRGNSTVLKL